MNNRIVLGDVKRIQRLTNKFWESLQRKAQDVSCDASVLWGDHFVSVSYVVWFVFQLFACFPIKKGIDVKKENALFE